MISARAMLATPAVGVESAPRFTPLPVPQLAAPTQHAATHFVITAIDDRGRLGDSSAAAVLGWASGVALTFTVLPGATGIVVKRGGRATLTSRGRLLLPVAVRRVLHLESGDRLLVAAHPELDLLIAYTMAAVDAMTAWLNSSTANGAAA